MHRQDSFGSPTFTVLAEEWMVAVLRELAGGALRPAELEQALSGARHTTIIRRLHHLLERDLVGYEHEPGLPPHACKAGVAPRALYGSRTRGERCSK
jgi:DNA-binding HxlR family transcriptional regulator